MSYVGYLAPYEGIIIKRAESGFTPGQTAEMLWDSGVRSPYGVYWNARSNNIECLASMVRYVIRYRQKAEARPK